jgi:hypothetical protein
MKRYMWVVPVVTLAVVAFFAATRHYAAVGGGDQNGGERTGTPSDGLISTPTRGVVFKTAAIDSGAGVANLLPVQQTDHLASGHRSIPGRIRRERASHQRMEPLGSGGHAEHRNHF